MQNASLNAERVVIVDFVLRELRCALYFVLCFCVEFRWTRDSNWIGRVLLCTLSRTGCTHSVLRVDHAKFRAVGWLCGTKAGVNIMCVTLGIEGPKPKQSNSRSTRFHPLHPSKFYAQTQQFRKAKTQREFVPHPTPHQRGCSIEFSDWYIGSLARLQRFDQMVWLIWFFMKLSTSVVRAIHELFFGRDSYQMCAPLLNFILFIKT